MSQHCYVIATTWSDSPVSIHFRALAGELTSRGHRVILLTDQARSDVVDPIANPAILTWPSPRPTKLRDGAFLRRLIHNHRPDCLIANFSAVNVMSAVGWWFRVPHRVVWYHTLASQLAQDSRHPWWRTKILRARKRLFYGMATDLVANSDASHEDLQQVYGISPTKCHRWYFSLPDPLRDGTLDSAEWKQRDPRRRIICTGRLNSSKGQDILIRALKLLKETVPGVSVEFIGEGPCRLELERLAHQLGVSDCCTFSGRLPHREVLHRTATASVAVVPSRTEAFGLVAIEAMSVGTPVVASAVGGLPELFDNDQEGFLVPKNDSEAMADRIGMLLRDSTVWQAKSEGARCRFLNKFEQSAVIPSQADWFENLVSGHTATPHRLSSRLTNCLVGVDSARANDSAATLCVSSKKPRL